MLTESFLAPYRKMRDVFPNLLARSTYLGKYCRDGETWTDTVRRCVIANIALDPNADVREAERLFDVVWRGKGFPPGRGLWTGGVEGIPVDARYNCHYGTIRSPEDWCWVADMLMCGGGVGVGLQRVHELPEVHLGDFAEPEPRIFVLCSKSHPNEGEVMPDDMISNPNACRYYVVEDSRRGWVEALRMTLECAWKGRSLVVNVSPIRRRGAPIRIFGGIACGPAPLAALVRNVWAIVRGAAGRRLRAIEALDITNHIGVCIKSGNVRRSALIALGLPTDLEFRDAKKERGVVLAHRHSSNNSIIFESEDELRSFDYRALVEDNALMGEPGILNLWRIRQEDPDVEGINPCGEIPLHDREACCLSEVYPATWMPGDDDEILRLMTRYTLRQRLQPMSDARADAVRRKTMRIGVGLGGICDFGWTPYLLRRWATTVREEATAYARELGVARPIATTTVKPSGTISLLNGSSPGNHAPFAAYYWRRTRISKEEPMAQALVEAGVPHEDCVYDVTGHTLVFAFPMRARGGALRTVQNETVTEQIERQLIVQESWADNAVSSTITFGEGEKGKLAELLEKYAPRLKSISCLPRKHGYDQPPYEAIDRATYEDAMSKINLEHPLTAGGDLETEECEGGMCPVK